MNKIHLVLIFSMIVLMSGIFLSIFWWFTYSFAFGSCTVLSYNVAPAFNCEFNSILDCGSSYCAHLFVFLTINGGNNYTSFIPVTFNDDNINPYNCWNILSFSVLKSYLQSTYPIKSERTCYINFEDKLILSSDSFYKTTRDIRLSGIVLMSAGLGLFAVYLLSFYFLRKREPPEYQVL